MHELSIACDIVQRVSEILERYPGSRAGTVTVAVGVYSGVDPAALMSSFPFASEGTALREVNLVIEPVAPSYTCRRCGATHPDAVTPSCPECGATDMALAKGRELEIIGLELLSDEDGEHGVAHNGDQHDTGSPEKQGART